MNFNFAITTIAVLAFELRFPVNHNHEQDYFFLQGLQQTAHLFRINATVFLHLTERQDFTIYTSNVSEPSFVFSWSGFTVDGEKMLLERNEGDVDEFVYSDFSFMSPDILVNEPEPTYAECTYSISETTINYWYIVVIVFLVGRLSDPQTIRTIINFLKHLPTINSDPPPINNNRFETLTIDNESL